jgi:outer membrane lipoprotein SlyB
MKRSLIISALMAVGLSACASGGYDRGYGYNDGRPAYGQSRCNTCGVVERIEVASRGSAGNSGGGAVAGAIIGGVLGSQIGSGDGRKAATVAGAIAGGVAGNRIERNVRDRDVYQVFVRMDDGRLLVVEQGDLGRVREGSRVVVSGGNVRLI